MLDRSFNLEERLIAYVEKLLACKCESMLKTDHRTKDIPIIAEAFLACEAAIYNIFANELEYVV